MKESVALDLFAQEWWIAEHGALMVLRFLQTIVLHGHLPQTLENIISNWAN
jgi:hypothetical protein